MFFLKMVVMMLSFVCAKFLDDHRNSLSVTVQSVKTSLIQ